MTKKWNSKAGCARGKQSQGMKNVRSGPWQVTLLERGKGIQDMPLHLGCWSNLEIMRKTSEQLKLKMKIDELTRVDNKFHQMIPFYGNEYM
jgi:hypothetical protein